jgi:uncharacterized protein (DUF2336 family)
MGMTPSAQQMIAELDAALGSAPVKRRVAIMRKVTDLYIEGAATFTEEQIAFFDIVMKLLAQRVGREALIELVGLLASTDNAPADTVNRLAQDEDIAVAGPILQNSNALVDSVLVEIAKGKGQKHLLAIAARARINAVITDALIGRGFQDVVRKVVANDGAQLSENTFVKLINDCNRDKGLAKQIAARKDIPEELQPFLKLALGA